MTKYFIKQVAWSALKLFLFITFMFFFIQIVMPGDFITQFSLGCNEACRAEMRAHLGLDLPIWKRYFQWLGQIAILDLGNSMSGRPVIDILKGVIPPTLLVFLTGTMIAFLIGSWLGKVTAWSKWGLPSRLVTLGGLTMFTSFPPWLAWLVTYAVGRGAGFVVMGEVGGLRQVSFGNLDRELWRGVELEPNAVIMQMLGSFFLSVLVFALLKRLLERVTKSRMTGIVFLILIPVCAYSGEKIH